jgi:hypothetical protein
MDLVYSDGGRAAAGYKGRAGDCVVRAIAIAAQKPYQEVYYAINAFALAERVRRGRSSSEPQRCRANDVRGLSTNTRLGMGTDHAGWFRLPSAPKNGGVTQGTLGGTAIAASHSGHRRCDPRHLQPRPQRHQVRLRILRAGPKSQKGGEMSTTNREDRKRAGQTRSPSKSSVSTGRTKPRPWTVTGSNR